MSLVETKHKEVLIYDICVIFEPCDHEQIVPLLDIVQLFQRPNGKAARVYPPKDAVAPYDLDEKKAAVMKAHAILLVLSDLAVNELKEEDGDKTPLYDFIKRASKRVKKDKSRIIPIFLSNVKVYEGIVGTAKFNTWYFKNEKVQKYMQRVGSLQGLFVDPNDWEAKFTAVKHFWEDTHNTLVPLNLHNFSKEVDWKLFRVMIGGLLVGCGLGPFACCFLCMPRNERFRFGIVLGMILFFIFGFTILFLLGLLSKSETCKDELSCSESGGDLDADYFAAGVILGIIALALAFVARFIYALEKRKLAGRIPKRMTSRGASGTQSYLKVDTKENITVEVNEQP